MINQWLVGQTGLLSMVSLIVTACIQMPVASDPLTGTARAASSVPLDELVGAWQVEASAEQQKVDFPALLSFTQDGIVLGDEPPSPFETTAHGNWNATSADTADFTFVALVGSQDGALSARLKVVGTLTIDAVDDTWKGFFQIEVADPEGNAILVDRGVLNASRIAVEPIAKAVFNAFNATVNAHNVDAALAFFAEDAVARFPNQPLPNLYTGKEEIRKWLSADAAQNIHVEASEVQVEEDKVTAVARVNVDDLRPQEITLEGAVEVTVQEGKITSFSYTLSEETLEEQMALTINQPIFAVFDPGSANAEEYEQISQALMADGAATPAGRLYHVAYTRDGKMVVADVWESRELFDQFVLTLVPVLQNMGVTPTVPQLFAVHNVIEGTSSMDVTAAEYEPIMAIFDLAAESAEQYDELTRGLEEAGSGSPEGRLYHFAYVKDETITVVDIWESSKLLQQFGRSLVPVLEEHGVTPVIPQIYSVHNIIAE